MSKNAANTDSQSSETQWADVIMRIPTARLL